VLLAIRVSAHTQSQDNANNLDTQNIDCYTGHGKHRYIVQCSDARRVPAPRLVEEAMSFFSYVEVAETANRPVVEVGTADSREVAAPRKPGGARLRIYAQEDRHQEKSTFAAFSLIHSRLQRLVTPDSPARISLTQQLEDPAHRSYFSVLLPAFREVVPVSIKSWQDLESWTLHISANTLLLEADGTRAEIQKLLDDVRVDLRESAIALADAEAPAEAAIDDSRQAAIDFRNQLLAKKWPDGKRVAELAGAQIGTNPNQYAARLRSQGWLFGVWSTQDRSYIHPDFQFDRLGMVRPEIADLLTILPDKDDRGGWQRAFWLYSPHALLEGKTPADVFVAQPERVIEVARREFAGKQNAAW
jgi:hypothetical protein